MQVLGIPGSLRRGSYSTMLLRAVGELFPDDVEFEIWPNLRGVPPFDQDEEEHPPLAVEALRDAIAVADALLVSTPEYNSSIPGQLKNALDWASRPYATSPLRNAPVAIIGASTGAFGAVWSQAELRKVLAAKGARVVEADLALGHAHEAFDEHGRLLDAAISAQAHDLVELLLAEAAIRKDVRVH